MKYILTYDDETDGNKTKRVEIVGLSETEAELNFRLKFGWSHRIVNIQKLEVK